MDAETAKQFVDLGISLLLGLLVGLQRQRSDAGWAGLRTFALITVFGTITALLAVEFESAWIVAVGFLGVVSVVATAHFARTRTEQDPGTTTEVAALVMFAVGAYLGVGQRSIGVALGAGTAVLLQFKPELHRLVGRLGDEDVKAIMQFVLITCVILPVLPNQEYGPFGVLNPFEIWLMVVLIVGVSLGGYVLYKWLGGRAGTLLGGILGGAISSTATTVSYARRATDPKSTFTAALAILLASSVVYARVLIEISVVSRTLLWSALGPILIMMLATLLPAVAMLLRYRKDSGEMPEQSNPAQLKSALAFGAMYALVLLALAVGKHYFSDRGLFVVATLSGLTDMDALTLSTARMVEHDDVTLRQLGWRLIILGLMSNLVFKTIIVGPLGSPRLLRLMACLFAIPFLVGAATLLFWPYH